MDSRFYLRVLATLSVAAIAHCSIPAMGQPSGTTARIPTVTRLVKQFFELETTLDEKLAARDSGALETLIDNDFEARSATNPGAPVPRADWIRTSSGRANKPRIDQMAVHDFGNVAVVSFMHSNRAKGTKQGSARMIVDCWKRGGDRWLLAARYESGAVPATSTTVDRKPTGRN